MFYKQQSYFSQIVSKKAKMTILFFMKNSKNNNSILGFRNQFYVFGFSLSNEQNKIVQITIYIVPMHTVWSINDQKPLGTSGKPPEIGRGGFRQVSCKQKSLAIPALIGQIYQRAGITSDLPIYRKPPQPVSGAIRH